MILNGTFIWPTYLISGADRDPTISGRVANPKILPKVQSQEAIDMVRPGSLQATGTSSNGEQYRIDLPCRGHLSSSIGYSPCEIYQTDVSCQERSSSLNTLCET